MEDYLNMELDGKCNPECVVQGGKYRFTVLTEEMVRMEYSEAGIFEDRPSQVVFNRQFVKPEFNVLDLPDRLEISTSAFHLVYNKKEFNAGNLYIDQKGKFTHNRRWYFGQENSSRPTNLLGTARTLDRADGAVELEKGLIDKTGKTFFDDSKTLLLDAEGWPVPRTGDAVDVYYLGYGKNYYKAIHDFYQLSGPVPMLPRFVLGNWWSRYYKYTEESYTALLNRFSEEGVPFSVVVIDMDWHLVDVPEKYGRGWTGYTWNRDFFPDPERFLTWLHTQGYKVTLNLHPADGVMPYEDAYETVKAALGLETPPDEPVSFDVTNKEFLDAYFKYLHHPLEKEGVDFWWIDWQQGTRTAIEGLDPLWMLNHFHFLDIMRNRRRRGLILSRYCGLGSHRYPIGFSGDTVVTWESLDFQPYFTATASNVGYTWWSHDIGGHMNGYKDNELMLRWFQFGVFSPINRIHSSSSPFSSKEPWRFPQPYRALLDSALLLRNSLVPYLYTMNYRCHNDLVPLIVPLYYPYPDSPEAFSCRNEYCLGSELVVSPVTVQLHRETLQACIPTWLPPGIWTDFFSGAVYDGGRGGRMLTLCRGLESIPVLVKAGGIIPLSGKDCVSNTLECPEHLEVVVAPGADNTFELFEDEGDGFGFEAGKAAKSVFSLKWAAGHAEFSLRVTGDTSVLPRERSYTLAFRGFSPETKVSGLDGVSCSYDKASHSVVVEIPASGAGKGFSLSLDAADLVYAQDDLRELVFDFLDSCQISHPLKKEIFSLFSPGAGRVQIMASLVSMKEVAQPVLEALTELLACRG